MSGRACHRWLALAFLCVNGTGSGLPGVPDPVLGTDLDRVPRAAQGRGVGQVEVADLIDGHAVEDRGGGDVDPLGDLRVLVAEQLDAEEAAGGPVAGVPHVDAVAAGIVGLVVVGLGADGDRVVPGRESLVVAEAGAGGGLVEDLHDLGAEAAGELPAAVAGVLPGDAALLVGGGAERQVGLAEETVPGDGAVPGGVVVGV